MIARWNNTNNCSFLSFKQFSVSEIIFNILYFTSDRGVIYITVVNKYTKSTCTLQLAAANIEKSKKLLFFKISFVSACT